MKTHERNKPTKSFSLKHIFTLHPSLHQSPCITLIYSSNPKISRCYHSDILHFIKSGLGILYIKHTPYFIYPYFVQRPAFFIGLNPDYCSSLLTDVRLLNRASRANLTEFRRSLAGALEPYCASSSSPPFCYFSPLRKDGNSRCGQPVR